jgi:hypothetical protein
LATSDVMSRDLKCLELSAEYENGFETLRFCAFATLSSRLT